MTERCTGQGAIFQSSQTTLSTSLSSAPPSQSLLYEFLKSEQHLSMFLPSTKGKFPTELSQIRFFFNQHFPVSGYTVGTPAHRRQIRVNGLLKKVI